MQVYGVVAILFVVLSILTFILETHPSFRVLGQRDLLGRLYRRGSNMTDSANLSIPHPALVIIDIICLIFFTLEIMVRFVCSPSQRKFFANFFNMVDLISLLPDYIEMIVFNQTDSNTASSIVHYANFLRIIRVFRVFRLVRHVSGLWIMIYTIKASMGDLLLMCVFMIMGMLLFASLIYYVEESKFPNIPISLWWALITMTTVGYGDMYPERNMGYLVGSLCAMTGLLVVGFTVPIIVNHFVLYYTYIQSALRAEKREKKSAKEKETLDNLIEEERRESILLDIKEKQDVAEQLSNGEGKDNTHICNGDIGSSTERKRKEKVFYTTSQQETIKMDLLLPPRYSSVSNLNGEFSKCLEKRKKTPTKVCTQVRRRSLPTIASIPFRQTCTGAKSPLTKGKTVLDDGLCRECAGKSQTSSRSENNIMIEMGGVDVGDFQSTNL